MRSPAGRIAAVVGGLAVVTGRAAAVEPGHERMVRTLERLAVRAEREHPFLGDRDLRRARAAVAALPSEAGAAEEGRARLALGEALLRLGRLAEAAEELERALSRLAAVAPDGTETNLARLRLGIAWLRLGETQNCCLRHVPESCILPILPPARHGKPEGSRRAIAALEDLLAHAPLRPDDTTLTARWLLSVAWMTLGGYPDRVTPAWRVPETAFASEEPFPRFRNAAPSAGLAEFNLAGGAVVDDLDGDGDLDVATSHWGPRGPVRIFLNGADGTFEDATEAAGLSGITGGLNLTHADYDNDGDVDLLVLRGAWLGAFGRQPVSLLRNDGKARFSDVTFAAGLGDTWLPTQVAAWSDYDLDGDLDVFVGGETFAGVEAPCRLYRNHGDGTFDDVASRAGVRNLRFTKGAAWGDVDGDGDPDLYVSNMDGPNRLYRNHGDGTFDDVAHAAGVIRPVEGFACWFWDYDDDGALDLFAAAYTGRVHQVAAAALGLPVRAEPSRLYRGDGKGGFRDVTAEARLDRPMLPMGSNLGDVDGDGRLDMYLGTGDPDFGSLVPNLLLVNRGAAGFRDVSTAAGVAHLQKGHGVAIADVDHDGDLDIFEQMGGALAGDEYAAVLYENPGFGRHWIEIELKGTRANRLGLGAKLRVVIREGDVERSLWRHVGAQSSFGGNPFRQTIGLGAAERIERIEVTWPGSRTPETLTAPPVDRAIRIVEGEGRWTELPLRSFRLGRRS